jgi:hypothetical protein
VSGGRITGDARISDGVVRAGEVHGA